MFLVTSDSGCCPLVGRRRQFYRNLAGLAKGSLVEAEKVEVEEVVAAVAEEEERVGELWH